MSWEGAGDGAVLSDVSCQCVIAVGIIGFGETADRSSSGRSRGRVATEISKWKRPPSLPLAFCALVG